MPVRNASALIESRCAAIASYHAQTRIRRAQLDVSGGVDSAVMLGLLAHAIGADQITAVYSSINSSQDSLNRARQAAQTFKVRLIELDLTATFEQLVETMVTQTNLAGYPRSQLQADMTKDPSILGSIRSCLRAPVGRGLNRMTRGGIRHGTGNECEDRYIRFYQKGGDGEVDTNPIEMLAKGEVYQLAHALALPSTILDALPSPDLHGNAHAHNDEQELRELTGVSWTYSRIDASTGQYTRIGTIEAMSRFLDRPGVEARLFGAQDLDAEALQELVELALRWEFRTLSGQPDHMEAYLRSARKLEATSRHKLNPAIPGLGSRAQLLLSGCLDNELPEVELAVD